MLKFVYALALAALVSLTNPLTADAGESNPIFGDARVVELSTSENQDVAGKGYIADFYGYYGNYYASIASTYGYYGDLYDSYNYEVSYYYNAYLYAYYAALNYYYAYYYSGT